ncbi:MAG: murein L,D-transpeptidase catalytic domain family protein [Flavobacterium sp.]|uniref:murein L,D-transpeptidase catalytic domain family protein n=1 Tax=Flavobacterium sp. TaxID=239 RepID=UPI00120F6AC5|nr:murein L,D-transpeptidase catalytic domain family protein [Flavobacterium sp.]RZJ67219.1 MAG: murein L,D-transpeptidase catalytic domain family protein [Flavobacterium sp.]
MIYKIFPVLLFFAFAFTTNNATTKAPEKTIAATTKSAIEMKIENVYGNLNIGSFSMPNKQSFYKALQGFYKLKEKGLVTKDILTLVDFSMSSNTKRLWVIDLTTNTVLYNSLVAHGRNTGDEFATTFSNRSESNMSSLGFYATGEIYNGKHGKSLKLDGLQPGVNDHARSRGVVMHAADYVSESFIAMHRRLGRSQGCPALPQELTSEIINTIKGRSCLFIYHSSGEKNFSRLLS